MKRKTFYIVLILFLLTLTFSFIYLIYDYANDKKYLLSENFVEDGSFLDKYFVGYDEYCKDNSNGDLDENYGFNCEIYYMNSFLNPSFTMNVNFGDNSGIMYTTQVRGLDKKEDITLIITLDMKEENNSVYCKIKNDFTVIEDNKNSPYCYTDDYLKFIDYHKEYIKDALKQYNSYYNNLNLSRVILE